MTFLRNDTLPLLAICGGLVLSIALRTPEIITSFFVFFGILAAGYELGRRWLPSESSAIRFLLGALGSTGLLMLFRGAAFYASLDMRSFGSWIPPLLVLVCAIVWTMIQPNPQPTPGAITKTLTAVPKKRAIIFTAIGLAIGLTLLFAIMYGAAQSGTDASIRTPWPLFPTWTLLLISLLWINVFVMAWSGAHRVGVAIFAGFAILGTTTLAPFAYLIGFGFDGFLHVAGERVLLETGTLVPKPSYYIGQYVFTTWIADLFEVSIHLIDRWLVPLAAGILIPLTLLTYKREAYETTFVALLFLPFSAFVATTPHGFATILAISTLLLTMAVLNGDDVHMALPIILALWTALTHPLVGLPIVGMIFVCGMYQLRTHTNHFVRIPVRILLLVGIGFTGFILPIVFGVASAFGSTGGVAFNLQSLWNVSAWKEVLAPWIPYVPNRFAVWPEASVWIEKLLPIIIFLFAISQLIRERGKGYPWLLMSLFTALSAILLTIAGDFHFLIDYERGNYAIRLWMIASLFLLPLSIPAAATFLERSKNGWYGSALGLVVIVGIIAAGTSYAALPRHDAVTPSRGWSVGSADIAAVRLIHEDANGEPYTVLANQSVSAAAVREFGFKRYNDDVFFYPIPTGGVLYEQFLLASYETPTRDIMAEAGRLGGSSLVYFVVNDYWWKADELIESAKTLADRTFTIEDGRIHVFLFELYNKQN